MKNLEYYLQLPYVVEVARVPEDQGGGYQACIPLLGRHSFVGDGDTPGEALSDLEQVKAVLLQGMLNEGRTIPKPQDDKDAARRGRILLRVPPDLHKRIAESAGRAGLSMNAYIQLRLSTTESTVELSDETYDRLADKICERLVERLRSSTAPFYQSLAIASQTVSILPLTRAVVTTDLSTSLLAIPGRPTIASSEAFVEATPAWICQAAARGGET